MDTHRLAAVAAVVAALTGVAACGTAEPASHPAPAGPSPAPAAAAAAAAITSLCARMRTWQDTAPGFRGVTIALNGISGVAKDGQPGVVVAMAASQVLASEAHTAFADPPPVGALPFRRAMVAFESAGYVGGYQGNLAEADALIAQGSREVRATTAAITAECG
jgi:hypothetical protein